MDMHSVWLRSRRNSKKMKDSILWLNTNWVWRVVLILKSCKALKITLTASAVR